ncbi:hypothetical protein UPYG_G00214580 [Umbra pygmaea]|uniref:Homeobox domain-containing protein n=1 Tax=Umbra pygmaea TaxID=75934 RepID=A0ABD0WKJ0_UMBPY
MSVSYLLEKNTGMYSNSMRTDTQTLNSQNFIQYGDFTGYHQVTGTSDPHAQTPGLWNPVYAAPWEEWSPHSQNACFPGFSPGTEQIGLNSPDLTYIQSPGLGTLPSLNSPSFDYSPDSQRRNSFDWIKCNSFNTVPGGKTRTKDKYRVVYTDQQRLDLEKEYQYSRYITIKRKTELALGLSLSERQVKIWFQNRRAKERKMTKKKLQVSTTTHTLTPPIMVDPNNCTMATSSSSSSLLSETPSINIKEEY